MRYILIMVICCTTLVAAAAEDPSGSGGHALTPTEMAQITGSAGVCWYAEWVACPAGKAVTCAADEKHEWCWTVEVFDIPVCEGQQLDGYWDCAIWDTPPPDPGCCTFGYKWEYGSGCSVHHCYGPPAASGYNDCTYGSAHIIMFGGCPFVPPGGP